MWECGLKLTALRSCIDGQRSLLMWECGLKPHLRNQRHQVYTSLLMWECGLKRSRTGNHQYLFGSLLMWECGLKLTIVDNFITCVDVTPYVGVWIETCSSLGSSEGLTCHSLCGSVDWNSSAYDLIQAYCKSLLMWECGLKRVSHNQIIWGGKSLLMWECGLKLRSGFANLAYERHSLCGSVDWNIFASCLASSRLCHSLCGSVDWNKILLIYFGRIKSHSLCGSVDWNRKIVVEIDATS